MTTPSEQSYPINEGNNEQPTTKICLRETCLLAGLPQPLDNFYVHKKGRLGRSSWCKKCASEYNKCKPPKTYIFSETDPTSKICTRKECSFGGVPQPLESFHIAKGGRLGRSAWCRECFKLYYHKVPRKPRVLRPAPLGFKICSKKDCAHNGDIQSIDNFCKNSCKPDELNGVCRDCVRLGQQKRKQANLERIHNGFNVYEQGKTKICSKKSCIHNGLAQPVTNFFRHIASYDGLCPDCKDCTTAHNKQWQANNKEKYAESKKHYAEQNKDRMKQYHHTYHMEVKKKRHIENWAATKIIQIKKRATKNGIPFDIDESDLSPLPVFCSVFGIKLDYIGGTDRRSWASVDRIKPSLGYTKGNVRIISMSANMAKFDGVGDVIQLPQNIQPSSL